MIISKINKQFRKDFTKTFYRPPTDIEFIYYECAGIMKREIDFNDIDKYVIKDELSRNPIFKSNEWVETLRRDKQMHARQTRDLDFTPIRDRQRRLILAYHARKGIEIPKIILKCIST